jgi:hypothetical protein
MMTPWAILLNSMPVLAMALAIVLVPLVADSRPRRCKNCPRSAHIPASENASDSTHMQTAMADVHLAKVR